LNAKEIVETYPSFHVFPWSYGNTQKTAVKAFRFHSFSHLPTITLLLGLLYGNRTTVQSFLMKNKWLHNSYIKINNKNYLL